GKKRGRAPGKGGGGKRENLVLGYQRVGELKPSVKKKRPSVRQALTDGNYQPRAIRRMDIPKPDGGVRTLGIPTVLDRLIQQAIVQQLSAIVDKSFSDSSYGFRPGRSACQPGQQAQRYNRRGKGWGGERDLVRFFAGGVPTPWCHFWPTPIRKGGGVGW
ncbi:hypothetical protein KCA24_33770, partial [Escherichia coli]|nr:hypothetical protein [Escherichia coli]